MPDPAGIAFDSVGNLFVADQWGGPNNGRIDKITPNGVLSVFADGYYTGPAYIAIQPTPEPSAMELVGLAVPVLFGFRRRRV